LHNKNNPPDNKGIKQKGIKPRQGWQSKVAITRHQGRDPVGKML
jgi:hypothetical protein